MTRLTVAVPTWQRPDDLRRCLRALQAQTRPVDEVLVVVRDHDDAAHAVLDDPGLQRLPVRRAAPPAPGFLPALRTAMERAGGDVVALLDDDAAPDEDWAERLLAAMALPEVVAVGGLNRRIVGGVWERHRSTSVGALSRAGWMTGMHYAESGLQGVAVAHLQGCNMAFVRPWPLPDLALRGVGPYNEIDLCLRAASRGTIHYDERIAVNHHLAARHGVGEHGAPRDGIAAATVATTSWNYAYVLSKHTSSVAERVLRFWQLLLVGQHPRWGLLRGLLQVVRGPARLSVLQALPRSMSATVAGWQAGRVARIGPGPGWEWST